MSAWYYVIGAMWPAWFLALSANGRWLNRRIDQEAATMRSSLDARIKEAQRG